MESNLNFKQSIGAQLVRRASKLSPRDTEVVHQLQWKNPFSAMHMRKINGVYRCINVVNGWNGVTVVGKNHLLDVVFGNATPVTQVDPWYIGLINQSPTPVLDEGDTLASHSGWSEFTSYSGGVRLEWDDSDAASKVKGSDTTSDFTISASGEVHGILVASVSSGTSGILWATGSFDASITVVNTDVLKITYGVRC
jgi:hypothetical protein